MKAKRFEMADSGGMNLKDLIPEEITLEQIQELVIKLQKVEEDKKRIQRAENDVKRKKNFDLLSAIISVEDVKNFLNVELGENGFTWNIKTFLKDGFKNEIIAKAESGNWDMYFDDVIDLLSKTKFIQYNNHGFHGNYTLAIKFDFHDDGIMRIIDKNGKIFRAIVTNDKVQVFDEKGYSFSIDFRRKEVGRF